MKNYKISGGQVVNRETGETADDIHGILTAAAVESSDNGGRNLYLTLADGENVSSLRLKYPGDASLKILRCLYGVLSTIKDSDVTILMRTQEGHSKASIVVMHGDQELSPVGSLPDYGDLRNALSDRLLRSLSGAVSASFPVLCVRVTDPGVTMLDEPDAAEVEEMIRLNRSAFAVTDRVFSRPDLAAAFLSGVAATGCRTAWATQSPDVIARIHEIVEEQVVLVPETVVADPEDNEEA